MPDDHCSPGSTNPVVTQDTIHETICTSGWTAADDSIDLGKNLASLL